MSTLTPPRYSLSIRIWFADSSYHAYQYLKSAEYLRHWLKTFILVGGLNIAFLHVCDKIFSLYSYEWNYMHDNCFA